MKSIILVPEARGLPFATMVAVNDPIVTLTKDDKFGPTLSRDYSRGYNTETKTIHMYVSLLAELKNYDQIIFVDDGIASGGTLLACLGILCDYDQEWFDKVKNNIMVIGIIQHGYSETKLDMKTITMFDF